jgi:DNA-directed RNA polymerase subunit RPC12/RpoP
MSQSQSVADGARLPIKCPKCRKMTEKPLSWFVGKDILTCGSCGHDINLKGRDTRIRIEESLRQAARVQAALTKAGDLS